jgi:hypothetical protein
VIHLSHVDQSHHHQRPHLSEGILVNQVHVALMQHAGNTMAKLYALASQATLGLLQIADLSASSHQNAHFIWLVEMKNVSILVQVH